MVGSSLCLSALSCLWIWLCVHGWRSSSFLVAKNLWVNIPRITAWVAGRSWILILSLCPYTILGLLTVGLLVGRKKPKLKQNELFCLRYFRLSIMFLENTPIDIDWYQLIIDTPINWIILVSIERGFCLGVIDICCEGLSVHCRMYSIFPGLYPLGVSSTPKMWQPKLSLGIDRWPLENKSTPAVNADVSEMGLTQMQKAFLQMQLCTWISQDGSVYAAVTKDLKFQQPTATEFASCSLCSASTVAWLRICSTSSFWDPEQ